MIGNSGTASTCSSVSVLTAPAGISTVKPTAKSKVLLSNANSLSLIKFLDSNMKGCLVLSKSPGKVAIGIL